MDTSTRPEHEAIPAGHRVSTDLRIGSAVLAVVIGGNLLWHATDAGIIAALGAR